MSAPLRLPTGPSIEIWQELAEEASNYTGLMLLWETAVETGQEHELDALEEQLLASLSHLRVHSDVMSTAIEEAMELADDLEEHELVR